MCGVVAKKGYYFAENKSEGACMEAKSSNAIGVGFLKVDENICHSISV